MIGYEEINAALATFNEQHNSEPGAPAWVLGETLGMDADAINALAETFDSTLAEPGPKVSRELLRKCAVTAFCVGIIAGRREGRAP